MLDNFRVRLASLAPLVLRVGVGVGFMLHGASKFETVLQGNTLSMTNSMFWPTGLSWALACTEFIGGACLVLGLLTRFWAAGMVIAMTVAFFRVHSSAFTGMWGSIIDAFSSLFNGSWNGFTTSLQLGSAKLNAGRGEVPWLYLAGAGSLFLMGPGCWSLDHLFGLIIRRRKANAVVGMGMRFPARERDDEDYGDQGPVYTPPQQQQRPQQSHPRLD